MDFDVLLELCGSYNRYQFVTFLLFAYINMLTSLHYFGQTIIIFTPDHWCYSDNIANKTIDEIRVIYADANNPSCTYFKNITANGVAAATAEIDNNSELKCTKWIYNYENGYKSISTEFNWVCEKSYKLAFGQSFFFFGSIVGSILFGYLADKIGRLPALTLSSLTGGTGDIVTSYINSMTGFIIGRFFAGLSIDTMYYLMYIIVFEYLQPAKRSFGLNIIATIFYTFGLFIAPWLGLWLGSWRLYLRITAFPVFLVAFYPFVICESAQWLLTKDRLPDAINCLKYIASVNGKHVEENFYKEFSNFYKQKIEKRVQFNVKRDKFVGLFLTPRLRKIIIILLLKSIIVTLSFDVLARNMEGFGISPFKLFSFTSLSYVPAGITIILLQNKLGRKGLACSAMFLGGCVIAIIGFIVANEKFGSDNQLLVAILIGFGRFTTTVAYDAETQFTTEILPTSIRGQGVAYIHMFGYALSFLSVYITFFGNYYKPLPFIVISVIMIFGAILCLPIPETLNKKLPATLEDGEAFGRDDCWYTFFCYKHIDNKI